MQVDICQPISRSICARGNKNYILLLVRRSPPECSRHGPGGELRGKVIISSNPHVCFLVSVFATTKLIFPRNGTKREREESREGKLTNDLDDKLTSCVRAENKKVFEEGKTACFLLLFFHERNMLLAALRNCYLRRNQIALDSMEMNET